MDGLSVAANIAGLITLADIVCRGIFNYVREVKTAKADIAELFKETTKLLGILKGVELIAQQVEGESFPSTTRLSHVYQCQQTLEKINKILVQHDSVASERTTLDKAWRRLHWPLSKSDTAKFLEEIKAHGATLTLSLSADSLSALLSSLSRQEDICKDINAIRKDIQDHAQFVTRIYVDQRREKIFKYLAPGVNPLANHQTNLRLRHPNTGIWVTECDEVRNWQSTNRSILWLYGIPGAGKTVIASCLIQESLTLANTDTALAFFYCDFQNSTSQDPIKILGSIAVQLSRQDEVCFEKLQKYYLSLNPGDGPGQLPSLQGLHSLILIMCAHFVQVMIIVDGLDECGRKTSMVVESLMSLHGECENMKSIFLSRDEPEIRDFLGCCTNMSIAARNSDLRLYVAAEIQIRSERKGLPRLRIKDPSLKAFILERLVDKAGGMFRWVACQMDYLCELPSDAARRRALDTLPPDLNSTYDRILGRINDATTEVQLLVQRALTWIMYADLPGLSTIQLCQAVSIQEDDLTLHKDEIPDEEEVLRWCSSLIRKAEGAGSFELTHFTVREYFEKLDPATTPYLAAYKMSQEDAYILMASTCLTYLCFEDFAKEDGSSLSSFDSRQNEYVFRQHASIYWPEYANASLSLKTSNRKMLALAGRLFNIEKSNNFVLWAQDYIVLRFRKAKSLMVDDNDDDFLETSSTLLSVSTRMSALHYAADLGLSALCKELLSQGFDPNQDSGHMSPLYCALLHKSALLGAEYFKFSKNEDLSFESTDRIDCVKLLLAAGARVTEELRTPSGRLTAPLEISLGVGDLPITALLLDAGAQWDDYCTRSLSLLLERWGDLSSRRDHKNIAKIFDAVELGGLDEQARRILQKAATQICYTGFRDAMLYTRLENVNQAAFEKSLSSAVSFGQISAARTLLAQQLCYSDAIDPAWVGGALHLAVELGHVELVSILLDSGADVNGTDESGNTVCHKCAGEDAYPSLQTLLQAGADLSKRDTQGHTLWHLAARNGNIQVLRTLVSFVTNMQLAQADEPGEYGMTPLLFAAESGSLAALEILWNAGHSPNSKDMSGNTLVHTAMEVGSLEIFEFLLKHEFDLAAKNIEGSNALHQIALNDLHDGHLEIIKKIVQHKVNINEVRLDGDSPLHLMCRKKQGCRRSFKILSVMTQAGADLDQKDRGGNTALQLLCRQFNGNSGYTLHGIEMLLFSGADPWIENLQRSTSFSALSKSLTQISEVMEDNASQTLTKIIEQILRLAEAKPSLGNPSKAIENCNLLKAAIRLECERLISLLLDFNPNVDHLSKQGNDISSSPMGYACLKGCRQDLFERMLSTSQNLHGKTANGDGLIHLACERGEALSAGVVEALLKAGTEPNLRGEHGKTPLMVAARAGNEQAVRVLLDQDADAKLFDHSRYNVVHYVCKTNNVHTLVLLHKSEAQWNILVDFDTGRHTFRGITPLMIAAIYGNPATIEFLLEKHLEKDVNRSSAEGLTALSFASANDEKECVRILLYRGAQTNVPDSHGVTPLMMAARYGHIEVVELFLDHGHTNLDAKDHAGLSAEVHARIKGHEDVATVLENAVASQASTNTLQVTTGKHKVISSARSRAFAFAIKTDNLKVCKTLIQNGLDINQKLNKCDCSPLLDALAQGRLSIAKYILEKGASVTGRSCQKFSTTGYTSLHYAVLWYKEPDLFDTVIRRWSELRAWTRYEQQNSIQPIHLAVASGNVACVQALFRLQSSRARSSDIDQQGMANLEARSGSANTTEIVLFHENMTEMRIDLCASSNIWKLASTQEVSKKYYDGATPLHIAAEFGHETLVNNLISRGAFTNSLDNSLRTPLHCASGGGHSSVVQALLGGGAYKNARDFHLETPLIRAAGASASHLDTIRLLVQQGADLDLTDYNGKNALLHAMLKNKSDVVAFLAQEGLDIDSVDRGGYPIAYWALCRGASPLTAFLLGNHLNLGVFNSSSGGVLNQTWRPHHERFLEHLISRISRQSRESLLHMRAQRRDSPLYHAATCGYVGILDVLIRAGANINLEGGSEGTPLMAACMTGNLPVIKFLVQRGAHICYYDENSRTISALKAAIDHPHIIRWFLVGRFVEIRKLDASTADESVAACEREAMSGKSILGGSDGETDRNADSNGGVIFISKAAEILVVPQS